LSTPPFLELPSGTCRVVLSVGAGLLSGLETNPPEDVETRAEVIFVPGFTGSKEDFLPLFEPLGRAGLRVLSIDQRGQCDSPGLSLQKAYTLEGYGEELRELIEQRAEAGVPVHVVAHSFGGYVVRQTLLSGPKTPLATVTLLATGPGALPPPAAYRVRLFLAVARVIHPITGNRLLRLDRHPDPAIQAFIRHRIRGNDRRSLQAIARWLLTEPDRVDELAATLRRDELPCFVLCGTEESTWSTAEQRSMAERLGVPFTAISKAGHSLNVDQPEKVVEALLGFWAAATVAAPVSQTQVDADVAEPAG
jgi:pimeloyl-ACP methyl ester carboxylesterase